LPPLDDEAGRGLSVPAAIGAHAPMLDSVVPVLSQRQAPQELQRS
jgi:hypothetical protein